MPRPDASNVAARAASPAARTASPPRRRATPRHRSLCATTQVRRGRRAPRTHGMAVVLRRCGLSRSTAPPCRHAAAATTQRLRGSHARRTYGVTARRLRVHRARRGLTASHGLELEALIPNVGAALRQPLCGSLSLAQTKVEERHKTLNFPGRRTNAAVGAQTPYSFSLSWLHTN
jgi:hypothetical protein